MGWIDHVLASYAESESPERFFYWSALAAMSATMRKNVWINRHYYLLYPNIYVIIMANSGLRKNNPIVMAKKMIRHVECTRIISGRSSIQGIIEKELSKQKTLENGLVITTGEAMIVSGELRSLLVDDPQALPIITDWYDTDSHVPDWKNTLKTSSVETIKEPCITLLGASNEAHLHDIVKLRDIEGGFIGRTFIVYESKKRGSNDLLDAPIVTPDPKGLAEYLKDMSKIKGEFKLSNGAKSIIRPWYKDQNYSGNDTTGTVERQLDSMLKISMLLSLADDFDLVIHKSHAEEALGRTLECMGGVKQLTTGTGTSELAEPTAALLKYLLVQENFKSTRMKVLSRMWGMMDAIVLDKVVETMYQAGCIEIPRKTGKDIVYKLTAEAIAEFSRFNEVA